MACDLCGKRGCVLEDLRESYKTPEVQEVCSDCATLLTKHLRKVQGVASKFTIAAMKQFIRQRLSRDPKESGNGR